MDDEEVVIVNKLNFERLTLSFKAMGGGLWDYNIDIGLLYCNQRWYEIIGVDPATNSITSIAEFRRYIHPDDVDMATKVDEPAILAMYESGENYRVEFRIIRPSGDIRWLRSIACVIRDSNRQLRAIGCATDITEFRASKPTPDDSVREFDFLSSYPARTRRDGEIWRDAATTPRLTERERECLTWASLGKTAWETAVILGRSRRTVEFHLRNAVRKLNAGNTVHAATLAVRYGLL